MSKAQQKFGPGVVQLTLPLSSLPSQRLKAGKLRAKEAVKEAIAAAIRGCGLSRDVIADEMSRLTGESISIHAINNWTAPAKADRSMPLEYAPALAIVTGDACALRVVAEAAGYVLLEPGDVPLYELGKITAEDRERAKQRRELWARIKA